MRIPQRHSIVTRVAESLREAIISGELREELPGVRQLSRDLHVSVPSVLEALAILKGEGLLLNRPGQTTVIRPPKSLPKKSPEKERTLVVLTFSRNWVAGSDYYEAAFRHLTAHGFRIHFHEFGRVRKPERELERLQASFQPDCWVLIGPTRATQEFFAERDLPCIIDGISLPDLPLPDFEVDYDALYRHAVTRLQTLGHRRICLLTSRHSAAINPHSITTFSESVLNGLPPGDPWKPVRTYDGTHDHFVKLLESTFLSRREPPTGVVVAMTWRVMTTLTWLQQHGLRVPDDVSIISRDHDRNLNYLCPQPASYRQPASALNRFVRAVIAVVDRKHVRTRKRVMTEFVPGGTIAAPPGDKNA